MFSAKHEILKLIFSVSSTKLDMSPHKISMQHFSACPVVWRHISEENSRLRLTKMLFTNYWWSCCLPQASEYLSWRYTLQQKMTKYKQSKSHKIHYMFVVNLHFVYIRKHFVLRFLLIWVYYGNVYVSFFFSTNIEEKFYWYNFND
jgi:hypothetical protein